VIDHILIVLQEKGLKDQVAEEHYPVKVAKMVRNRRGRSEYLMWMSSTTQGMIKWQTQMGMF
jgi:hypothetical protein